MTAKDYCSPFKDKHKIFVNYTSNTRYSNLNLNQSCDKTNAITEISNNIITNSKNVFNYDLINSRATKDSLFLWNKKNKNSSLNVSNNYFDRKKLKEENDSETVNNSTLSLHISAYENSINGNTDLIDGERNNVLQKKLGSGKTWENFSSSKIQNPFEFRRQQENNENKEPEVAQFKTSQKLLNPNKTATTKQKTVTSATSIMTPTTQTESKEQPSSQVNSHKKKKQQKSPRKKKSTLSGLSINKSIREKLRRSKSKNKKQKSTVTTMETSAAAATTTTTKQPGKDHEHKRKKSKHPSAAPSDGTKLSTNYDQNTRRRKSRLSTTSAHEPTSKQSSSDLHTGKRKSKTLKSKYEDKENAAVTTASPLPTASPSPSPLASPSATAPAEAAKFTREKATQREREKERLVKEAKERQKAKEVEVSSSTSSSEAEQDKPKQQQIIKKKPKMDEATTTLMTVEKKESNKESPKKKKKESSQELTDNTPTVFENVDAPLKPMIEEMPTHKIELPTDVPKKGTGKAAVCVDNTPTAYGNVKTKKKSKKKEGDSDDDSDYLPIHPAYK